MNNIEILDRASGGPFVLLHHGAQIVLPSPIGMDWQRVLGHLELGLAPETPLNVPAWSVALVAERWSAHYDLPDFNSARRLAYLVDRYRSALVADLQRYYEVDLGTLWRDRRWRTLLDYIDHLPGHSWFTAGISMDEEHAAMMAESLASRIDEGEEPTGPGMQTWTPEVAAINELRNDVRDLTYVTRASQGDKTAKPPPRLPTPVTALEGAMKRAKHDLRKAKHNELVARMLPNRG